MRRARALHDAGWVHVVGFGVVLMLVGAIAVLFGLRVDRRARQAEAPTTIPQEVHVRKHVLDDDDDDDDDESVTHREPPRGATSPWSTTAVDDAQLPPAAGQGLALAPGRHTIIVVCSDCAKARTLQRQLAARASLSELVLEDDEEELPITSATVFEPIEEEPLRHAHGGRATPRHAADPWDYAHHDRRRRR